MMNKFKGQNGGKGEGFPFLVIARFFFFPSLRATIPLFVIASLSFPSLRGAKRRSNLIGEVPSLCLGRSLALLGTESHSAHPPNEIPTPHRIRLGMTKEDADGIATPLRGSQRKNFEICNLTFDFAGGG